MNLTLKLLAGFLFTWLTTLSAADAPAKAPNIVLILADDLGYADLGCQGSPDVKTQNIDSFATNGVRCTAGYVTAPQCSPSRAGLMSGRYQQQYGHEGNPNFPLMLMGGGKTIADHLKAAGYATAHYGKWHLGFEDKATAPKEMVSKGDWMAPTQYGFDTSFGYSDYAKVAKKTSISRPHPMRTMIASSPARRPNSFSCIVSNRSSSTWRYTRRIFSRRILAVTKNDSPTPLPIASAC
jgi:arylsulfatase A-like enzyme